MRGILIAMTLLIAALPADAATTPETAVAMPDWHLPEGVLPPSVLPGGLSPDALPEFARAIIDDGFIHAVNEQNGIDTWNGLLGFGDVNGDGRADVLHMVGSTDEDEDDYSIELLSAGNEKSVIWTIEVDEDDDIAYAPISDVTGDGRPDIVAMELTNERSNGMEYSIDLRYTVLDGRDLEEHWFIDTEAEISLRGNSAPLSINSYSYAVDAKIPLLGNLDDSPGADLFTIYIYDEYQSSGLPLMQSSEYTFRVGTTIERVIAGEIQWTAGSPDLLVRGLGQDVNDDGVADMLFASFESKFNYNQLDSMLGTERDEPESDMEIATFSGADGAQIWSHTLPEAAMSGYAFWIGDLYGEGVTVAAGKSWYSYESTLLSTTSDFGSQIMFLDGALGTELANKAWNQAIAYPAALGDVDGDGLAELYLITIDLRSATIAAVHNDFSEVWSRGLDGVRSIRDLNGDAVNDLMEWDDDEYVARTGVTGGKMWEAAFTDVVDYSFVFDISKDGGYELMLAQFKGLEDDDGITMGQVTLVRGSDGVTLWTKPVFDPMHYTDKVYADHIWFMHDNAQRVSKDSVNDPILYFSGESGGYYCDENSCYQSEENEGLDLNLVMLVSGATGNEILRYDNMPLAANLTAAPSIDSELGPAGISLQSTLDKESPGAAVAMSALALLGLVAIARRR